MTTRPIFGSNEGPRLDAGAPWLSAALFAFAAIAHVAGEATAIWVGLAMFVAGLGHGAGDENGGAMRGYSPLLILAYVVTGLAIAALFLAAPLAGLALFLSLSAWHFARSDSAMSQLVNLAIAMLAIGGSALLRANETAAVFAAILGRAPPDLLMGGLQVAGAIGLFVAAVAVAGRKRGALSSAAAALACAAFHPVLAVGLIFLVMHALPIQRRQIAAFGVDRVVRAVAAPTIIATLGAAAIGIAVWQGWLALELAVALAFGMATPHMLTERLEH